MIEITALKWAPPQVQGLVRDLRLRWALREAGLPYTVRLVDFLAKETPAYRADQPFGQVPIYREDELVLFESGAIVLHIAEQSEALLPRDPTGCAHAIQWLFAALNSIEPFVQDYGLNEWEKDTELREKRRPKIVGMIEKRLGPIAARLDGREWLEDRFTCADLIMATVLRILRDTDLATGKPALAAYLARLEARPAFQAALAEQLADFAANSPPSAQI